MTHLRSVACLATLLVAAVLSTPAAGQQDDPLAEAEAYEQQLFDRIAPSVVFVSRGGEIGSAFYVREDGLALTNQHVVGDADEVEVVTRDGQTHKAEVTERVEENIDLALIKVPVDDVEPLELDGVAELRVGSWVGSVGHGMGGVWTFTKGMVSNIYPSDKKTPVFQTQIPLNPGASGAPVFDRKGRVVGIATAGITESNSVNFAIRSDAAFNHLDMLERDQKRLRISAPEGAPIFVGGRMVGKGPTAKVPIEEGTHEVFAIIDGEKVEETVTYPDQEEVVLESEE